MDMTLFLKEHVIDIIAAAIFLLMMFIGAKRGFLRTLSEFVCSLLAFTAAKLLSTPAAAYIYKTFYQSKALALVNSVFADAGNSVSDIISRILKSLPGGIGEYALESGIVSAESITNTIENNVMTAAEIETNMIRPVAELLLRIALFAVISLLVGTVLRIVARIIINSVRKGTVVRTSDTVLGIVIGGLKGFISAFIFGAAAILLSYVSSGMAEYTAYSYICMAAKAVIGI
ncbi:MAG: hypothetical protein K6G90_06035 [Clostridia bacterium]|nr:hypothetical protein [Clostridia bacterium]